MTGNKLTDPIDSVQLQLQVDRSERSNCFTVDCQFFSVRYELTSDVKYSKRHCLQWPTIFVHVLSHFCNYLFLCLFSYALACQQGYSASAVAAKAEVREITMSFFEVLEN